MGFNSGFKGLIQIHSVTTEYGPVTAPLYKLKFEKNAR